MQNPTVLIVEDEADLADVIRYNLLREDIYAKYASNGKNALKSLDPMPDIVLLDIMLPDMSGIDICKEYIDVASKHNGLKDIKFLNSNFMRSNKRWDIVFMHGSLQTQKDFKPWLNKLLNLTEENGYILITSYFNPYDVDMKIDFCDYSNKNTRNVWRSDYNFHSQYSVSKFLKNKCKHFKFIRVPMNVSLKRNKKQPQVNSWTFKNFEGKNILTNGMRLILEDFLLLIKK